MDTIRPADNKGSAAAEAAAYFIAHPRRTKVRVANQYTDAGQPHHEWHYTGPRKDFGAVYAAMNIHFTD